MTTLKIGGPLAIACKACGAGPGRACIPITGERITRRIHAARVKAAPPELEVAPGDLVVVQFSAREVLALVRGGTQDNVALRFWSVALGWSTGDGHLEAWRVLRLAPEDEQTAAARAALKRAAA